MERLYLQFNLSRQIYTLLYINLINIYVNIYDVIMEMNVCCGDMYEISHCLISLVYALSISTAYGLLKNLLLRI